MEIPFHSEEVPGNMGGNQWSVTVCHQSCLVTADVSTKQQKAAVLEGAGSAQTLPELRADPRAQGTPQGWHSGKHCFIAGSENLLLGCRAKLWHQNGCAQQATWASTLPGSCGTKAHPCKPSSQTRCLLHGQSQESCLLMSPPLWLHSSCSNLPGLIPHITAQ